MSIKSIIRILIATFFLFSHSCNENGNPAQQTGTTKSYGVFKLMIDQVQEKASFIGRLYNGPVPIPVWETVMVSGECKLLKPKQRTCPGCGNNSVCVDDNNCQPEPDTITAGTVTIAGMINKVGATTSTVTPTNANYLPTGDNRPKNPPCAEGSTISVTASGNEQVAGFTVSAKTINPIEVSADSIAMDPGKPILLKWKAASNPDDSKITVVIDITYHGGTKAKIECVARDDGELEIPAAMLDSLKTFGMSGYPKLEMYRDSKGIAAGTGVELQIQSFVLLWLRIPGVISCPDVGHCPEGMECSADKRCREVQ